METEKTLTVGGLTIEIDRNQKRLNKRKCDAQHMVKTLRVLADCFDEQIENAYITEIEGDKFDCRHPDVSYHGYQVKKKEDYLTFPTGIMEIATDIRDLEKKLSDSNKRLRAELDCD